MDLEKLKAQLDNNTKLLIRLLPMLEDALPGYGSFLCELQEHWHEVACEIEERSNEPRSLED